MASSTVLEEEEIPQRKENIRFIFSISWCWSEVNTARALFNQEFQFLALLSFPSRIIFLCCLSYQRQNCQRLKRFFSPHWDHFPLTFKTSSFLMWRNFMFAFAFRWYFRQLIRLRLMLRKLWENLFRVLHDNIEGYESLEGCEAFLKSRVSKAFISSLAFVLSILHNFKFSIKDFLTFPQKSKVLRWRDIATSFPLLMICGSVDLTLLFTQTKVIRIRFSSLSFFFLLQEMQ